MYRVVWTNQFKKDYKLCQKQGKNLDKLDNVIKTLAEGKQLPISNKDHLLSGDYKGYRECHIQPDWLLIYKIYENELILVLVSTGSHSDLFN